MTINRERDAGLAVRRLTDFEQIRLLYHSRLKKDFARSELKPLSSMRRLWEQDAYDCYGLFDGEEILGYAFFARLGETWLFDYLAISDERRGRGLGSLFLRELSACFADGEIIRAVSDIQAGDAEEQLGGVVGDHDDPVHGFAGGVERTVKQDVVADEEQRAAAGDQDSLDRGR